MPDTATVFGLDVSYEQPIAFLERACASPTGRTLELAIASDDSRVTFDWPDSAELVCEQRKHDGSVVYRIEAHPAHGYLIRGPAYGSHLLSPDGRRAVCAPEDHPEAAWQRLLIAQVLPFAAVLQGLEVFHASAVVRDGGAVLLVGPSGAGKTSVALAMCAGDAEFLADDVVAVERTGEELLCHPGSPLAGLDHGEASRLEAAGGRQLDARVRAQEIVAVDARERLVRMPGALAPAPLRALFLLDRRPDAPAAPHFETIVDPKLLLASTFNGVLTPPERLRNLLDICALAARHHVERATVGPHVDATQLAAAIGLRLDGA